MEAVCALIAPDQVQERTQMYRDMAGMAALVTGRGDSGFHEFDEWLAAVSHSIVQDHTNGSEA